MLLLKIKYKTAIALGIKNIGHTLFYRISIKLGFNRAIHLKEKSPQGEFFTKKSWPSSKLDKPSHWDKVGLAFSHITFPINHKPPNWYANPLTGKLFYKPNRNWWKIADFDPNFGDIKLVWELSRFDWVVAFAQLIRTGKPEYVGRLNEWLNDWCSKNQPYKGPNWKCGQETSFRVINLALSSLLLNEFQKSTRPLVHLINIHLKRIVPTINYGIAQDNNHATSEAAALFIGGSWLDSLGHSNGAKWYSIGRKLLEKHASRLINEDGSFSQYSLNYHRLMLDTFSIVEVWRIRLKLPPFSKNWQSRSKAATNWLYHMVNPWNGDGPNLGGNDGARLLQLTNTDYRDYRPSVQLASVLFTGSRAYSLKGPWDHSLNWLGLKLPSSTLSRLTSKLFNKGGYAILLKKNAKVLLNYPRFSFRPSHADALHLDLWVKEKNLLRDAGSYKYNTNAKWLNYFPSTKAHNTIQFDNRDQMPRLSRFLFGDWLKASVVKTSFNFPNKKIVVAGYKDYLGVKHKRLVTLKDGLVIVNDKISGFSKNAVLRWRLKPGNWKIQNGKVINGSHTLQVSANVPFMRCKLVEGWESKYYNKKNTIPVFEVEVNQNCIITTKYFWN